VAGTLKEAAPRGSWVKRGALVLLALLLAGCTAPDAAPPPEPRAVQEAPLLLGLAPPERVVPLPLALSVSLSERWLKPLRGVEVDVEASPGAMVAWFASLEEAEPRASSIGGDVFLMRASTQERRDGTGPRAPASLAPLEPDGRARTMHVAHAGRYAFAAEGARLVVNAWPQAPAGAAQAFLLEEDGALRFEPPELDVAPGARVLVWSQVARAVVVEEVSYAAWVPLEARGGRVTPVDEGLWTLVAVAVGANARGAASASFLVDFERPSDRLAVGPYAGDFAAPEAGAHEPRRLTFGAEHPLQRLRIGFAARSSAPAPASVVVALYHEDALLGEASSVASSEMLFEELPAGKYALVVRGEHGALVGYEVAAEGLYRLPTPARLRETTTT